MAKAACATDPDRTRGRRHPEPESARRTPFQRDRDRIIHSSAFRRLKHKTQVFVMQDGDYFRTRLTHTLEVAQVARTVARALGLDEDLAEAVALAHDLGHTPFGHAGERALNRVSAAWGGFDHNAHSLRIVTALEHRYAEFDGLNLTWETLEGLAKHNGPATDPAPALAAYDALHPLELGTHASAEAQVAALSDDIAYTVHDLDDGLRAGLFTADDLLPLPRVGAAFAEVDGRYPDLATKRRHHEALRRVFGALVEDLIDETLARLAALDPAGVEEVRAAGAPVAAFSAAMRDDLRDVKQFLFKRMYRHYKVNRMTAKARRIVEDLFATLLAEPRLLPPAWREAARGAEATRARAVADYIAGMTDRYAIDEHRRLLDPYALA